MALYEKRHEMPPHLAEIPYGFKNLWRITVSAYDLQQQSFHASNIESVVLNGGGLTAAQLKTLYDYNRDGCSLIQSGSDNGLYVTLTGYDEDTYSFQTIIEQNLEISGVLGVQGDMVDNSNPQLPVIGHDDQKLDASRYETDLTALDERLENDEAAIQSNADSISDLRSKAVTDITLNGKGVPVTGGTATIEITALTPEELSAALSVKVDKTVAGAGNKVVQELTADFKADTRTLSLKKTLLSLENGSKTEVPYNYPLAELLGITSLEAIDKELFYFVDDSAITTFSVNTTIQLSDLYRPNPDGTFFKPITTKNIQLLFAVSIDYSGFGQESRRYISAIGRVVSATSSALTCAFTNLVQYMNYTRFNGYRAGTVLYNPGTQSMFHVLQSVPVPTAESNVISLSNSLYYVPVKDDSIMNAGTIWANFEAAGKEGRDYSSAEVRLRLLEHGSGYDEYVSFASESVPARILTNTDWNDNISLWVTDGLQFSSLTALLDYLSNFPSADRFKMSNRGIISTHYESGGITITPVFTKDTLTVSFADKYQPIPSELVNGYIPVYDSSNILISSGKALEDFATAEQGDKADSAVQSVTLSSGATNGRIKLTVDGAEQYTDVPGLGSAAYKDASAFATASQGEKADSALQSVSLAPGAVNGTVQLTVNGVTQSDAKIAGIKSAAFAEMSAFATAEQGEKADSSVQSVSITPGVTQGTIQYSIAITIYINTNM